MADNPLTQVHDYLWTTLEASSDFTAQVPQGNRIKLTGTAKYYPQKMSGIVGRGFPTVSIVPDGFDVDRTSTRYILSQRWSVRIATDDKRITLAGNILNLQWVIIKALSQMSDGSAFACDPLGEQFGLSIAGLSGTDNVFSDPDLDKGTRGWATLCTVETTLKIERSVVEA